MDEINKKVSNQLWGTNDLQSVIIDWLGTFKGELFKSRFDMLHQGLLDGEPLTIEYLKAMLETAITGFGNTFTAPIENMLYGVDRSGTSRREICDDETFEDLVKAGDCINFLMNAWVDVSDKKLQLLTNNARCLHQAFRQPFQGQNVDWIEEGFTNYKNMYDVYRHYGRMVPVVQSSGMGKSRTMAEWAKRRLILSICFRDILGDKQSGPCVGWPPGDKPVYKFFASPPRPTAPGMKEFKGEELAGAFLGAFYTVVADLLQKTTLSEPEDLQMFYASWTFDDPTNIEESPRHKTFIKVCEIAEQLLERNEVTMRENRGIKEKKRAQNPSPQSGAEAANSLPQDRGQFDDAQQAPPRGRVAWYDSIFTLLVKEKGEELMEVCRKSKLSSDLIVVLDECDELDRCNKGSRIDKVTLLSLLRIIKAGEKHNIWFFLIETGSGILDLLPRMEMEGLWVRLFRGPTPLPPWVYFEHDVMLPSRTHPTTPWEAMSLDCLKWYGRPYWSTLQDSDLLTAAEQKLYNNKCESNTLNYAYTLSARLALELETDKASARVAIQSVRSHMRILTGWKDSHTMTTCAPSEPVLAAAAASLPLKDKWKYQEAVDILGDSMIPQGVLIDKGRRNELVARILLMLARDSNVLKLPISSQTVYHIPAVTLREFLDALLGERMAISNFSSEQQKAVREDLREWARSYYLNFTHFIHLRETFHALSADFLMECWCRGVALVCSSGQPVFDILLITYKGRLTDPFDKSLFGLVAIQVGLRETPTPSRVVDLLTCPIVLVEEGDEHRKPDHLVIFMDLGTTEEFEGSGGYCYISNEKAKQPGTRSDPEVKNSTQNWQGYVGENEPFRYCINIRHHTFMQYAVMHDLGPALYKLWEGTSPDFAEIADKMESSLDPLRGKLLATTESWFEAQGPSQEGMDVDL